jgi:adenylate kinase
MMRVILLGAPGCGKGSVGELIREAYGIPKISTGDLLRESVRMRSPLGIRAESQLAFEIQILEETLVQRLAGRRICPSCEAIYNIVSRKPVTEGICDRCGARLIQREDDRPEVIEIRLKTYHAKTEPLLEYYQSRGVLHPVDGNGTVGETFTEIRAVLDKEYQRAEKEPVRP